MCEQRDANCRTAWAARRTPDERADMRCIRPRARQPPAMFDRQGDERAFARTRSRYPEGSGTNHSYYDRDRLERGDLGFECSPGGNERSWPRHHEIFIPIVEERRRSRMAVVDAQAFEDASAASAPYGSDHISPLNCAIRVCAEVLKISRTCFRLRGSSSEHRSGCTRTTP